MEPVRKHSTRLSRSHEAALDPAFTAGQRVQTIDGVPGRVLFADPAFAPGVAEYQVVLDNGMGRGTYTASQLRPLPDDVRAPGGTVPRELLPSGVTAALEAEAAEARTADLDYPEMGTILRDRPDPGGIITILGSRTASATYGRPDDARDEDYNGGEDDTGVYWAEPGQQEWARGEFGPQEEAPPPPWMMAPAMGRLAAIEEARSLIGSRHHATDINGTHVDDHGDAPQHGTIPRAGDPESYDGRSTEGQGDPKWDDPVDPHATKEFNGATVGMFPEGISSGSGPGLSIGPVVAHQDPAGHADLEGHLWREHGVSSAELSGLRMRSWHTYPQELEKAHGRLAEGRPMDDWEHEEALVHGRMMLPEEIRQHLWYQHGNGYAGASPSPHEMQAEHASYHMASDPPGELHGRLPHHDDEDVEAPDEDEPDYADAATYRAHPGPIDPVFGSRQDRAEPVWMHGAHQPAGAAERHLAAFHDVDTSWGQPWSSRDLQAAHDRAHDVDALVAEPEEGGASRSHDWAMAPHRPAEAPQGPGPGPQTGAEDFTSPAASSGVEYDPVFGWRSRASLMALHREARVPWTPAERGKLHAWQDVPTVTWGDFVPSQEFRGAPSGAEEDAEGVGAREGAAADDEDAWHEHMRASHGWRDEQFRQSAQRGNRLRHMHEALHDAGMANHAPHHVPPDPRRREEQHLTEMFGLPTSGVREGWPEADEPGGTTRDDPMGRVIRSVPGHEFGDEWDAPWHRLSSGAREKLIRQLAGDYPPQALDWIRSVGVTGPVSVPLSEVDWEDRHTWTACRQPRRVHGFIERDEEGKPPKPALIVATPAGRKVVIDGHHRLLGRLLAAAGGQGEPEILAYVASVDADEGPWDEMHGQQLRASSKDGTGRVPGPDAPPDEVDGFRERVDDAVAAIGAGGGDDEGDSLDSGQPRAWPMAQAPVTEGGPALTQGSEDGKRSRKAVAAAADPELRFHMTASWRDVVAKAKRIRAEGSVRITHVASGTVIGEVRGDHATYESGFQAYPGRRNVMAWTCGCPWASFHQNEPRGSSRYAGRMCSHAYAVRLEAQSRGMFGREVAPGPLAPPHDVVVRSWPPYEGEPHAGRWREQWMAPSAALARTAGLSPSERLIARHLEVAHYPGQPQHGELLSAWHQRLHDARAAVLIPHRHDAEGGGVTRDDDEDAGPPREGHEPGCYYWHSGPCPPSPGGTEAGSLRHPRPREFWSEVTENPDFVPGSYEPREEATHVLTGHLGSRRAGAIHFLQSDDGQAVHVSMLHTADGVNGRGVASAMMDDLYGHVKRGGQWISHGMRTEPGNKWWATYSEPHPELNVHHADPAEGWHRYFNPHVVMNDADSNRETSGGTGAHSALDWDPGDYPDDDHDEMWSRARGLAPGDEDERERDPRWDEGWGHTGSAQPGTSCLYEHEGDCPPLEDGHDRRTAGWMPWRRQPCPLAGPYHLSTDRISPENRAAMARQAPAMSVPTHVVRATGHDGSLLGTLHFQQSDDGRAIHVSMLHTARQARGNGVASSMMGALYEHANGSGAWVDHGSRTRQGARWWGSYSQREPYPHLNIHNVPPAAGWHRYFDPQAVAFDMASNYAQNRGAHPVPPAHDDDRYRPAPPHPARWSQAHAFDEDQDGMHRLAAARIGQRCLYGHEGSCPPLGTMRRLAAAAFRSVGVHRLSREERIRLSQAYGPAAPTHAVSAIDQRGRELGHLHFSQSDDGQAIHVHALHTADGARGQGIASSMMDELYGHAARSGAWVNHGFRLDDGIAWWGKYGAREPDPSRNTHNVPPSAGWGRYFNPRDVASDMRVNAEGNPPNHPPAPHYGHPGYPDQAPDPDLWSYARNARSRKLVNASWDVTADQANAPWGSDNVSAHPPAKPYGATSPPDRDTDPGSYGPLAGPDPDNWGGIEESSPYQMPLSNTAALDDMSGQERQESFPYGDQSAAGGPATSSEPRDPQGIRMEESLTWPGGVLAELRDEPEAALPSTTGDDIEATAAADGTIGGGSAAGMDDDQSPAAVAGLGEFGAVRDHPGLSGVVRELSGQDGPDPSGSVRARFRAMFGGSAMGDQAVAEGLSGGARHPSPAGQEPGMGGLDEELSPDDQSIQTIGNQQWSGGGAGSDEGDVPAGQPQGGIDDVVAAFQRSAAARQFSAGAAPQGDGDIAAAARQYLSKVAEALPQAEADALIREGRGQRARNLDLLQLEGTHYEDEDATLASRGLSLDDFDDDVISV